MNDLDELLTRQKLAAGDMRGSREALLYTEFPPNAAQLRRVLEAVARCLDGIDWADLRTADQRQAADARALLAEVLR